jgi:general secretion pathway protein H
VVCGEQKSINSVKSFASKRARLGLLGVLLGVALVSAVTVISLAGGERAALAGAAGDLAAALRHTRKLALNENRPVALVLDIVKRELRVPGEAYVRRLPGRFHIALYTARLGRKSEVGGTIRFFPDGSSTGGRIALSYDGVRYLVNADWLTGKVSVIASVVEAAIGR